MKQKLWVATQNTILSLNAMNEFYRMVVASHVRGNRTETNE